MNGASVSASFKKTCLSEGVTSQWRYERRKSGMEEKKERGQREKKRREEKVQTGKVGRKRNGKRSRGR